MTKSATKTSRARTRTSRRAARTSRLRAVGARAAAISGAVLRWLMQRELWGLAVTAFGAVTVISLLSPAGDQGELSGAWSLLLRQIFGLGAYPIGFLLLASGIALLVWNALEGRLQPRWRAIVGAELLFFGLLGLVHILSDESPWVLAQLGRRGGYIGWALVRILRPSVGQVLGTVALGAVVAAGLVMATGSSWRRVAWRAHWLWAQVGVRLRGTILARQQARAARRAEQLSLATVGAPGAQPVTAPAAPAPAPRQRPAPKKPRRTPKRVPVSLPSLDLLVPDDPTTGDDADARMRAQIIQETLDAFGVPAEVTEWRRGPVVTQFGIVPGYVERQDREGNTQRYKIRVSKVLSLANDLALALAASPIRIEAPVPGRPVIGIEVPNAAKSVVGLRGVLESEAFQKSRAALRIALGRDVSGQAVVADLARMPHLLLAGATGTGKSACLNAVLASLLFFNSPERLKLLLVDPKRVELTRFNSVPHLIAPAVVDTEKVIVALRWVMREMEQRYEQFAKAGARNLEAYNRSLTGKGLDPLPMIAVVIDELADVMLAAPDEVERVLCRIAQMARATGIHLVVATQRPSVDVVTGLIKANF
ncbi:MAG: DNA translocase FtsK, partial [Chloroflexi bacterium]|nr:DNA translocase FtsK [Chloroflexota bacterium]